MPQLRSFQFNQGPSLPDAYKTGYDINQNQQQIDQRGQIAREQIANQYAIAEMEAAARRQALQQQALMQAQELEVNKSLKQQALGLQARELEQKTAFENQQLQLTGRHYDTEAQKAGAITDQAARKYEAQQRMRMQVQDAIKQGKSPGDAIREAAAVFGTEAGASTGLMGDLIQSASGGPNAPMGVPKAMQLEGAEEGTQIYQASPNRYALVPRTKTEPTAATPVPGSDNTLLKFGNKFFPNPKLGDVKDLTKERDALKKKVEGDEFDLERRMFKRAQAGEELADTQKAYAKTYADAVAELQKMNAAIASAKQAIREGGGPKAALPADFGAGATTNKMGRFNVIQRAR